jgi:hypothetical protein
MRVMVIVQDAKIDSSEFLQIQLLRTGKVDRDTLEPVGSELVGTTCSVWIEVCPLQYPQISEQIIATSQR